MPHRARMVIVETTETPEERAKRMAQAVEEAMQESDEARGRYKTACEHVGRSARRQKAVSGERLAVRDPK